MTGVVILAPTLGGFSVANSTLALFGIASTETVTTTSDVTATPNVAGTYTYQWLKATGDDMTPLDPTAPNTYFSAAMIPGDTKTANYYCQVRNNQGFETRGPNVLIELTRT